MIIFNKVSQKYADGSLIFDEISFTIDKGEFVFIVGPSGVGKTTLSRLLTKELTPTLGEIFIENEPLSKIKAKEIPGLRQKIGTAFQDFKIFLDRTVAENINLPLEIIGLTQNKMKERVEKVIDLVGLQGKDNFFPAQLSGGEIQRVGIARAIIHSPKILFADEPTGNLDLDTGWGIIDLLKRINEGGTTLIVATHNLNFVESLGKRVITLDKGKIVSDSKKESPKTSFKKAKTKKEKKVPLRPAETEQKPEKEKGVKETKDHPKAD